MNIKEIKEMINLMNENNLTELEVEKEGMRIRLKKSDSGEISMHDLTPKMAYSLPPAAAAYTSQGQSQKETATEKTGTGKTTEIKSPMVGTFYRAPSPESPAFAEINQSIEVGQVVCIVEAMKLMNEIKSEIKGKIVDILIDNAEPVEFGQPLFLIEPA
ncbi:MAG TPA: acetyl-CoA carboxylase biotin carboxyl carrier protein [Candidatus Omnitrophica bacterium]|nr:acetyl-CoA carboxylase biotin carboxyl carrier protein [Candidatus Omnitrophota bacterium]